MKEANQIRPAGQAHDGIRLSRTPASAAGSRAPRDDRRPVADAHRGLVTLMTQSPRVTAQRQQMATMDRDVAQRRAQANATTKPNQTGLPDGLKAGIEQLSGVALDDVKVHYNSSQPATLQAHAYAQGTDIHIAPGQEKHLPHEAWHVVQQKQGRVKPTMQLKGTVPVNDDAGLEKEADVMGAKSLISVGDNLTFHTRFNNTNIVQRVVPNENMNGKPIAVTGSYRAKGGQDIIFDQGIHQRQRFSFGTNTRYEVFSRYNPTRQGNRIISIMASNGEQVNVNGIQLDHQISWDRISNEMQRYNNTNPGNPYTFWDAKMYYNDIDNLVPALGAINAAAGEDGVAVESRLHENVEGAIGAVQHSWMHLQQVMTALNNGAGFSQVSDEVLTNILLDINSSFSDLAERLLGE